MLDPMSVISNSCLFQKILFLQRCAHESGAAQQIAPEYINPKIVPITSIAPPMLAIDTFRETNPCQSHEYHRVPLSA